MKSFNDGKVCDWFENGTCSCFLNGSRCDCPFSKQGCEIQCRNIFKEKEPKGEGVNRYKSNRGWGDKEIVNKKRVYERLNIKKGERVADWFIPYKELTWATDPSVAIDYGVNMVKQKFKEREINLRFLRIYHNFKQGDELGVYIIGTD